MDRSINENRNLMVNRKVSSRTPTYPNPPRTFKSLHESPRISLEIWGRGILRRN